VAGGVVAAIQTTSVTGSWPGLGACLAASQHPFLTFMWYTLPRCSSIAKCAMTTHAVRSMEKSMSHTTESLTTAGTFTYVSLSSELTQQCKRVPYRIIPYIY